MKRVNVAGAMSLALLLLAGCGGGSPSAPTVDSITVASISPAAGTVLRPGQAVTFTATFNYTFATADEGQITMIAHDQTLKTIIVKPQPTVRFGKGTGNVTLTDTITIPASGVSSVLVVATIQAVGAGFTNVWAEVSFPVQ